MMSKQVRENNRIDRCFTVVHKLNESLNESK